MTDFHNRRERTVIRSFCETMRTTLPSVGTFMRDTVKVDRRNYLRSDLYNLFLRPIKADEFLILRVREPGRPLASLSLGRAMTDAPFGPNDRRILDSIAGFVAHGMMRAPLDEDGFVDGDHPDLLVVGFDGRLRHASAGARQLLLMALIPRFSLAADWNALSEPVPDIVWLCRSLIAAADGELGRAPPVLRRRSPWGEFVLRAYWLGPTDGAEPTRDIGITIERRVPRALAMLRRIEELPLTAREKQLCLLLARDPDRDDLAEVLGVEAGTAITHQRNIYAKLGVHSRAALVAALQPGRPLGLP